MCYNTYQSPPYGGGHRDAGKGLRVSGRILVPPLYYCGQSPVTRMLHEVFETGIGRNVEFANAVRPSRYRLFQLADLICTLHLIELKLRAGVKLSRSENQFFGGPQMFRHNILRYIKAKEV